MENYVDDFNKQLLDIFGENYIEIDLERQKIWDKCKRYLQLALNDWILPKYHETENIPYYSIEDVSMWNLENELILNKHVGRIVGIIQNPINVSKEEVEEFKLTPLLDNFNIYNKDFILKLKDCKKEAIEFAEKYLVR